MKERLSKIKKGSMSLTAAKKSKKRKSKITGKRAGTNAVVTIPAEGESKTGGKFVGLLV